MSARTRTVGIVAALVRRRPAHSATLLLLGAVLAGLVAGMACLHESAEQALEDSLLSDVGRRAYVLQTGDAGLKKAVSQLPGASPVQDDQATLTAGKLTTSIAIRSTTDPDLEL